MRDTIKIDKNQDQIVCGVTKQATETDMDKKLDATNKGYKMMKMMGWSGGGLGSQTQGREDPVGYLSRQCFVLLQSLIAFIYAAICLRTIALAWAIRHQNWIVNIFHRFFKIT